MDKGKLSCRFGSNSSIFDVSCRSNEGTRFGHAQPPIWKDLKVNLNGQDAFWGVVGIKSGALVLRRENWKTKHSHVNKGPYEGVPYGHGINGHGHVKSEDYHFQFLEVFLIPYYIIYMVNSKYSNFNI